MHRRLHIQPARNNTQPKQAPRSRVIYLVVALAVVAIGLLWRSRFLPLPPSVSNHGGDAMWALMVFVGFGFLLPHASTMTNALMALTFAWGVEFSQLYHAPWIDSIRATLPGRLVLGNTFYWLDLIAYAVGIALGALTEWKWHSSRRT